MEIDISISTIDEHVYRQVRTNSCHNDKRAKVEKTAIRIPNELWNCTTSLHNY